MRRNHDPISCASDLLQKQPVCPIMGNSFDHQIEARIMLKDFYAALTVDQLKNKVAVLSIKANGKRKTELVDLVVEQVTPPRLNEVWNQLPEIDQKAVAEVVHNWHGVFDAGRFYSKYGSLPQYFKSAGRGEPGLLALFFVNRNMAVELIEALTKFVAEPPEMLIATTDEKVLNKKLRAQVSPYKEGEVQPRLIKTEELIRHDLPTILRLVEMGKISVSAKTGVAGKAGCRVIESALMEGDYYGEDDDLGLENWAGGPIRPIRPYAWPLMLQSAGLVKIDGTRLELSRKGLAALKVPWYQTVKEIYERWRSRGPDEFKRISLIKGQGSKGRVMTKVSDRRADIELALTECPVNEWIHVDEFFRFMRASNINLEVAQNPWKLYLGDPQYGSLGYEGTTFDVLEGRYILVYLFEYLATLGVIDIAIVPPYWVRYEDYRHLWGHEECKFLSRYDGLLYFRLNPLGAYCLGLESDYQPTVIERPPLLSMNGSLVATLLRPSSKEEALLLETWFESNGDDNPRLTFNSVLAAVERGLDPEVCREFLAVANSGNSAAVDDFFNELQRRRCAFIEAGEVRLIRCKDRSLVRLATSDPATAPFCHVIDGNTLAVPFEQEEKFRRGLQELGYIQSKMAVKGKV